MNLFAIAASGMADATARLDRSASRIMQGMAEMSPDASGAPAQALPAQPSAPFAAPAVDLGMEMVSQVMALDQFKASVRIFEAGDETFKTLLNLKA